MSLVLWMYIVSILSEVEMISAVVVWIIVIVTLITVPVYAITSDGFSDTIDDKALRYIKSVLMFVLLPAIVLVTVLPNKNEMYIMIGLHYGEKVLTSEKGNELLDKSYEALIANIEKSTHEAISGESKQGE